MALVAAAELRSLMETAHLLRSPKNTERLLRALRRAKGRTTKPGTVADIRKALGLEGRGGMRSTRKVGGRTDPEGGCDQVRWPIVVRA